VQVEGFSKSMIAKFLGDYLLECSERKGDVTKYNISEKMEELEIINKVFQESDLEAEIYGARYFIRYSNFEPAQ
jgi:hypothetical protein